MLTLDMLRRLMALAALVTLLGGVLAMETQAAAGAYPRTVAHSNFSF